MRSRNRGVLTGNDDNGWMCSICCRGAAALQADTVTAPVRPAEHCRSQSQHRQEKAVGKLGSRSGWRLHQDAQKHQKIASWLACAHGRRSVGGQGDMSPLLFEVEGTPFVLSPPTFRGWHFFVMHNCTAIITVYSSFEECWRHLGVTDVFHSM